MLSSSGWGWGPLVALTEYGNESVSSIKYLTSYQYSREISTMQLVYWCESEGDKSGDGHYILWHWIQLALAVWRTYIHWSVKVQDYCIIQCDHLIDIWKLIGYSGRRDSHSLHKLRLMVMVLRNQETTHIAISFQYWPNTILNSYHKLRLCIITPIFETLYEFNNR
jgi:hypothetical protein